MNTPSLRSALVCSLLTGTFAIAQQATPIPAPSLPPVPTTPAIPPAVPGAVPMVTIPPVAPASQQVAPAAPATYTIQTGDNPWSIAKKHGVNLEELLKVNEIKDAKNLMVGDVLKLPAGATSKAATPEAVKPTPAAPAPLTPAAGDDWESYTIQSGDNPWKIAKALKVEHQKIVKLNEGVDFTKLKIGQQIKVPKKP